MKNGRIDVIIPAYKAHKTIFKTVASIAEQTVLEDVDVTIVNDACPEGDYHEVVEMYRPVMNIREIRMSINKGPGLARQYGIDRTHNEFFTCMDADDTLVGAVALETLRTAITEPQIVSGKLTSDAVKCVSGTFIQLGDTLKQMVPHSHDMVWMFGKLYRREFIEKYKIRFNETRANEDTGFNTWVRLICSNPMEQIRFIPEVVYYWHNKPDSITRINGGQYRYDQCMTGWTDNMIYAIRSAKRVRPFDQGIAQWTVSVMLKLYFYYVETVANMPVFATQCWEYVKKFYNLCYKNIEADVTDELFAEAYSIASQESWKSNGLIGVIPSIGIREFMERLHSEKYDPEDIYDVWEKIPDELVANNEKCGVCPAGYTKRKERG